MDRKELRTVKNKVAALGSKNLPLDAFLREAGAVHSAINESVEGIWCGRDGRVNLDIPGVQDHTLVVGWYEGKVEYAYVS